MNILLSLFFSLVLTSLFSFAVPIAFLFVILGSFSILAHFDLLSIAYGNTRELLAVFGEGSVRDGIFTIGMVSAVAGLIFEALNFYRYQTLIEKNISSALETQKLVDFVFKMMCPSKG
jgi:hypothetical protein